VLINIITGVSPPHFDFFVFYVLSMLRNFLTIWHEYNIPFWISTTNVFSKFKIFKFLKRDCGTIPVAEIISGKIDFFSKYQRFLIATKSSKYLLIFVLYVCFILCELADPTDVLSKFQYLNFCVNLWKAIGNVQTK
jgi:hypothetical protein